MRMILEKLLELANLLFTGFTVTFLFKPQFNEYFPYFLAMIGMMYGIVGFIMLGQNYLAVKREKLILKKEKKDDNGE